MLFANFLHVVSCEAVLRVLLGLIEKGFMRQHSKVLVVGQVTALFAAHKAPMLPRTHLVELFLLGECPDEINPYQLQLHPVLLFVLL